ncbi:MAG: hypothetical protein HOU01_01475 [Streptomycetaceae bacterium]|nr:hypothetical protein [Streptomycetaceae bacterium]
MSDADNTALPPFPLRDFIATVRADLTDALAEGRGAAVRFEAGPVEVEVTTVVTRDGDGTLRVGLPVVGGSGSYRHHGEHTQRLRISLQPVTLRADGSSVPLQLGHGTAAQPR